MVLVLTGGERHEQPVLPTLMERGAVKRKGRYPPWRNGVNRTVRRGVNRAPPERTFSARTGAADMR
jgi:hypothetical protein